MHPLGTFLFARPAARGIVWLRFCPKFSEEPERLDMKLRAMLTDTAAPFLFRMSFVTNYYRRDLVRLVEKEFGLTRPEWAVLFCLGFQEGISQSDIYEITGHPKNSISRGVSQLSNKKLVVPHKDPIDSRRSVLQLSAKGRAMYNKIMPLFEEGEYEIVNCLTKKERGDLDKLLTKICDHTIAIFDVR